MQTSLEANPQLLGTVALSALNLTKTYGRGAGCVRALNGISVNIRRGELTVVGGTAGAGKTTLLHCLAGLDRVTAGRVFLSGQEISQLRGRALFRATSGRVSLVATQPRLLPEWTALQNILLPLDLTDGRADHDQLRAVVHALELEKLLAKPARELTGLQQQRISIARAAIIAPEVIFVDTVCGATDGATNRDLSIALRAVCRELGQTVVMATRLPSAYADRVLMLDHGLLVDDHS
jgi:putative ABC transport system ATP-binding protein